MQYNGEERVYCAMLPLFCLLLNMRCANVTAADQTVGQANRAQKQRTADIIGSRLKIELSSTDVHTQFLPLIKG